MGAKPPPKKGGLGVANPPKLRINAGRGGFSPPETPVDAVLLERIAPHQLFKCQ